MSSTPEPAFDLSEIVGLYKEDARHMIQEMRAAAGKWNEVSVGGPARGTLRRLSHQLRGSGRTYGFRNVTRVSKAVEQIIWKLEKQAISPDERLRLAVVSKIDRLESIFRE
jgi:chemotaxis protein histidine kinase CheA